MFWIILTSKNTLLFLNLKSKVTHHYYKKIKLTKNKIKKPKKQIFTIYTKIYNESSLSVGMVVAPLGGGFGCPAQKHTIYPPNAVASYWKTSKNWLRSSCRAILSRSCGAVISPPCTIALSLKTHTSLTPCDSFVLH